MKVKVKVKQDKVVMWCCDKSFITAWPAGYMIYCPFCKTKKPSYYVEKFS
jgi:hypothetical protein